MHVELTNFRYGPGVFNAAGQRVEVPDAEGEELLKRGHAKRIEIASITPPQNAAARTSAPSPRQARGRR